MNMMGRICVLLALLLSSGAAAAQATTVLYNDFSDTTGLVLNGTTTTPVTGDGTVLRLTSTFNDQSGSVFSSAQVNAADFSTFFKFRISSPGGTLLTDGNTEYGADGIVFVVQSVSSSVGGAGGGIGYGGISNSVGVEFDTWHNSVLSDPDSNHLGIDTQGSLDHGIGAPYTIPVAPNFDDGQIWYAWVDYDGTTLEVRANQTGTRPASPLLSRALNIPVELGNVTNAYVGFTSGTGYDWGNHDILAWEYRSEFAPIGIASNSALPEPSSLLALLGLGFCSARARIRRRAVA